jgi:hypothetical protein
MISYQAYPTPTIVVLNKNWLMINASIRLTTIEDVRLLPGVEYSAGERFRDIPHLAWIADDDVMTTETHLKSVKEGTSWVAEVDHQVVGFVCGGSAPHQFKIMDV